ncbi:MAG TPA: IS1 family transposase [Kofleriaceae bacterium]
MANHLHPKKQLAVLATLVEGCSVRSTERLTGVHRDTICRLLVRVGAGCEALLDARMVDLPCRRLELDEMWSFVLKKQRAVTPAEAATGIGDQWIYVAICADSKVIPSYRVGKREAVNTNAFVADLAGRLRNRVQLSTDGLRQYVEAIDEAFGSDVDYAQIVKEYESEPIGEGKYSPPKISTVAKTPIVGEPIAEWVSTSYVERQNLTMRMGMRRFTRLTNGFSKKVENHRAAVALHVAHYNFVRVHSTLRTTPAMAAGVESVAWDMADLLAAVEEHAT